MENWQFAILVGLLLWVGWRKSTPRVYSPIPQLMAALREAADSCEQHNRDYHFTTDKTTIDEWRILLERVAGG